MFNWMVNTYHTHSAADEYWFGFVLDHMLYVVMGMRFEELARFFKLDHTSSARGGYAKVRIRAKAADLRALQEKALLLGPETLLEQDAHENRGNNFERVVVERFTDKKWVKDTTPFWVAGDMQLDGKEVQIKFNNAELTNEKTLKAHFA